MFETRPVHITRSAPGTSQNVVAVNPSIEMMMIAREIVVETRGVMDVVAAEETARLAVMEDKAKETVKVIINNPVVVVVVDAVNRGEVSPTTIENK